MYLKRISLTVVISLAALSSCGGGGSAEPDAESSINDQGTILLANENGPGDVDNLFPAAIGNRWNYEVIYEERINSILVDTVTYTSVRNVSESQQIGLATRIAIDESNYENSGQNRKVYFDILPGGINFVGDSEPDDEIDMLIVPYIYMMFPFSHGNTYNSLLNVKGRIPDADLDSIDEEITINSVVEYLPFENLVMPAGSFQAVRLMKELLTVDFQFSYSGQIISRGGELSTSFMSNVGVLKEVEVLNIPDQGIENTTTYLLKGYDVDGSRKGIQPQFEIDLPGLEVLETPGVAFDGDRYFIAFTARVASAYGLGPLGLYGLFLNLDGTHTAPFSIIDPSVYPDNYLASPAIAFDGTNFLMVYSYSGHIYSRRFAINGIAVDSSPGTQISDTAYDSGEHKVHFNGTNYFIIWSSNDGYPEDGKIKARFVSNSNTAAPIITITDALDTDPVQYRRHPVFSFNGTNYLVAWLDGRNYTAGNPMFSIYASRVSMIGEVLDPSGVPILLSTSEVGGLRAKYENNNYIVLWDNDHIDPFDVSNYYSKRVSNDGVLIDAPASSLGSQIVVTRINNIEDRWPVYFDQFNNPAMWRIDEQRVSLHVGQHALALWISLESVPNGFDGALVYEKH